MAPTPSFAAKMRSGRKYWLPLALLAAGCHPCTQLPLSEADRHWTAAYPALGQLVALQSAQGHTLRYTVAERVDTYNNLDCNWLELGITQPAHFHVTLRPAAAPFTERQRDDLTLYVLKWSDQQPATLDFRLTNLEAYFHEKDDHHHFRLLPRPCTLRSGRQFPQAYYFEAGQNAIAYGATPWRSFCWDPQVGLLRLEAADGEVFDLVPTAS